jgi:ABC-type polar amino acid transport system ATPase subunit
MTMMVTHEMGFARKVANRVIFMDRVHRRRCEGRLLRQPSLGRVQQFGEYCITKRVGRKDPALGS